MFVLFTFNYGRFAYSDFAVHCFIFWNTESVFMQMRCIEINTCSHLDL